MRHYRIPIFTEEYAVHVLVGKRPEIVTAIAKYTTYSRKTIERDFGGRGVTYNVYPDKHPIIGIDGDLKPHIAVATLAHEASHAIHYLERHIGLDDSSDEFRAHGIATILRTVLKSAFAK